MTEIMTMNVSHKLIYTIFSTFRLNKFDTSSCYAGKSRAYRSLTSYYYYFWAVCSSTLIKQLMNATYDFTG